MATHGKHESRAPSTSGAAAPAGAAGTPPLGEFDEFDVLAGLMPPEASEHEAGERGEIDATQPARTANTTIEHVQEQYADHWMAIDGVEGVAIGEDERTGEPALLVYVSTVTDEVRRQIPAEVEGFPVRVISTPGGFETLPASAVR
jgi:hypothetical protein